MKSMRSYEIGDQLRSHHICLPWLDQPLKRAEFEYEALVNPLKIGCLLLNNLRQNHAKTCTSGSRSDRWLQMPVGALNRSLSDVKRVGS